MPRAVRCGVRYTAIRGAMPHAARCGVRCPAIRGVMPRTARCGAQYIAIRGVMPCAARCGARYTAIRGAMPRAARCGARYTAIRGVMPRAARCGARYTAIRGAMPRAARCGARYTAIQGAMPRAARCGARYTAIRGAMPRAARCGARYTAIRGAMPRAARCGARYTAIRGAMPRAARCGARYTAIRGVMPRAARCGARYTAIRGVMPRAARCGARYTAIRGAMPRAARCGARCPAQRGVGRDAPRSEVWGAMPCPRLSDPGCASRGDPPAAGGAWAVPPRPRVLGRSRGGGGERRHGGGSLPLAALALPAAAAGRSLQPGRHQHPAEGRRQGQPLRLRRGSAPAAQPRARRLAAGGGSPGAGAAQPRRQPDRGALRLPADPRALRLLAGAHRRGSGPAAGEQGEPVAGGEREEPRCRRQDCGPAGAGRAGRRRVEVLRGAAAGPRPLRLLPAGPGRRLQPRPPLHPLRGPRHLQLESSDPDQLVYKTPEPSEKVPGAAGDVAQNSYLGFSVDSGAGLTRRRELSFVTGAPRANHTGAVVILRRDSANRLVPEAVLPGQQLTSAFGYAVAVLDLNSDGWMDLVVGAPHFFERKEEIGGAAYVYINPAGRWDSATPLRLNGTRGSMFGIALSTAGDLNQDGFEDLAVGAPFDGAGKVYIYHGSNLGIVAKPAQVLDGEGVGVTAFGYSLSGGLDVDGNLYPDLLVGSLSDSVVLYRARPVVHVSRNVSLLPPNIDLEQSNCQHQEGVCVDVRACFSYTASPASYSPRLVLEYVFDADTDRRRLGQAPRVTFLGRRPSDPEHQFSNTVELPRQHARACVKATFQLQDSIRDKLRPIAVTLAYGIQGAGAPRHSRGAARHSRGAALPPLSPVLSPQQPSSHRTEVHFLKQGCGDDKICQSNLQLRFQFCARLGDADFLPLPRGADGTAIFAMSDQKDVALEIHVTNLPSDPAEPQRDGDDAHEAMLTATFPPELPYAALRPYDGRVPSDKPVVCLANQNGSQVECELGNPMKRGAQVRFFLILSTLGITIQTTDLAVELALSTISEQPGLEPVVARARVVIELPLSVTGVAVPPRLFFGGVVRGESAMRRESQVGSAVRFEVTVSNRGQSLKTLGSAFLTLLWPHEISNGKWLLYPLHLELAAAPGQRAACSPSANPLRLALEPPGEADPTEPPTSGSWWVPAPAERRRNVTLDCAQGTARCLAFHCPLHSFERAAVLTARGRLWNSTFLEEYLAVTSVELIVRASVSVTSSIKNLVLKDASTQIPISIYLDPGAAVAGGVPWWVILLAVLAGILVLALLVFILWKLGFFRRARYAPPAVPQYHAVKIPREERQQFREEKTGTIQRKEWAANLSEASNSHVAPSSA
ncbi:integrin alpha-7 isoform X7 [Phalacrocorax carbo]|uniref:integrin alpha-7 isoform X7 n=1 Tax=Phalacrocorax carbo TaxID=9209 RepID=UPI0031196663